MTETQRNYIVAVISCLVGFGGLYYSWRAVEISIRSTQMNNVVVLINEASVIAAKINSLNLDKKLLIENQGDQSTIRSLNRELEDYQNLLFKIAIMKDEDLIQDKYYKIFVDDFCVFFNYKYVKAWWASQRERTPYALASRTYRTFDAQCSQSTSN